eukprot:s1579_g24.t1
MESRLKDEVQESTGAKYKATGRQLPTQRAAFIGKDGLYNDYAVMSLYDGAQLLLALLLVISAGGLQVESAMLAKLRWWLLAVSLTICLTNVSARITRFHMDGQGTRVGREWEQGVFRQVGLDRILKLAKEVRKDNLVTRVPQERTDALHGARPVPADPSLSSGLSSGPSSFGEMPPTSRGPVFAEQGETAGISSVRQTQSPPRGGSPPGLPQGGERNQDSDEREGRDIFNKSEKWLPSMPTIDFSRWRNRADEVLGFSDWVQALRAWVSLGSDVFAWEISQCIS